MFLIRVPVSSTNLFCYLISFFADLHFRFTFSTIIILLTSWSLIIKVHCQVAHGTYVIGPYRCKKVSLTFMKGPTGCRPPELEINCLNFSNSIDLSHNLNNVTSTAMPCCRNVNHQLHQKLSKWHISVEKILSRWHPYRFSGGQLDIPNDRWSDGALVRKSCTSPNGQ